MKKPKIKIDKATGEIKGYGYGLHYDPSKEDIFEIDEKIEDSYKFYNWDPVNKKLVRKSDDEISNIKKKEEDKEKKRMQELIEADKEIRLANLKDINKTKIDNAINNINSLSEAKDYLRKLSYIVWYLLRHIE